MIFLQWNSSERLFNILVRHVSSRRRADEGRFGLFRKSHSPAAGRALPEVPRGQETGVRFAAGSSGDDAGGRGPGGGDQSGGCRRELAAQGGEA